MVRALLAIDQKEFAPLLCPVDHPVGELWNNIRGWRRELVEPFGEAMAAPAPGTAFCMQNVPIGSLSERVRLPRHLSSSRPVFSSQQFGAWHDNMAGAWWFLG